jgi:asparagine synthase (glutamine-hydrolysing)
MDALATRLWVLGRVDLGNYNKGMLGGWGIDVRDPTADRRLVEFCLAVPPEQCLANGVTRALARRAFSDRLPPALLEETRKGYQGADWHEGLTASQEQLHRELEAIARCPAAAEALDVRRLIAMAANWPKGSWHRREVTQHYRLALLRGISGGHFLRKATGAN